MIVHLTKRALDFYAEMYKILNGIYKKFTVTLINLNFSSSRKLFSGNALTNKGIGASYCKPTLLFFL